jgi:hypothetical protein
MTNAEAFVSNFPYFLKGIQQHLGVLLLQFQYQPTLLYTRTNTNLEPFVLLNKRGPSIGLEAFKHIG